MYVELDDIKNIFTVLIKSDVVMLEFNGIFCGSALLLSAELTGFRIVKSGFRKKKIMHLQWNEFANIRSISKSIMGS